MSPVLVLLLLSPLLLSLLIVGMIVCIAIVRVAPTDVQGVLKLLVRLLTCLGRHFPSIDTRRTMRQAPDHEDGVADEAVGNLVDEAVREDDFDGGHTRRR